MAIHKRMEYRRFQERKHRERMAKQHNRLGCFGVYYHNDHYVNSGRGKRSAYVKRKCNKQVRRTDGLYRNGDYRKVSDYWWELI